MEKKEQQVAGEVPEKDRAAPRSISQRQEMTFLELECPISSQWFVSDNQKQENKYFW